MASTGSPADKRHYEPKSRAALQKEFPDWRIYKGTDQLLHAELTSDPNVRRRGEDLVDLRDKLITYRDFGVKQ